MTDRLELLVYKSKRSLAEGKRDLVFGLVAVGTIILSGILFLAVESYELGIFLIPPCLFYSTILILELYERRKLEKLVAEAELLLSDKGDQAFIVELQEVNGNNKPKNN